MWVQGFTATSAERLFRNIEECGWAFDVELLALAHRCGLEVKDFPVTWIYDPQSSVGSLEPALRCSLRFKISARMTNKKISILD